MGRAGKPGKAGKFATHARRLKTGQATAPPTQHYQSMQNNNKKGFSKAQKTKKPKFMSKRHMSNMNLHAFCEDLHFCHIDDIEDDEHDSEADDGPSDPDES